MSVEIVFVPAEGRNIAHIGEAYTKEDCLRLIGEVEPEQTGIYEYIVHEHKVVRYVSTIDRPSIERTLNRIFNITRPK